MLTLACQDARSAKNSSQRRRGTQSLTGAGPGGKIIDGKIVGRIAKFEISEISKGERSRMVRKTIEPLMNRNLTRSVQPGWTWIHTGCGAFRRNSRSSKCICFVPVRGNHPKPEKFPEGADRGVGGPR
jgi:hypothetical protein